MRAVRRFNNNVVLCIDDNGQEVVAFGKGLGFHELPYEVSIKEIEKSYYGIENKYLNMINDLSKQSIEIASKVLDMCRIRLKGSFNPNLLFILADHIDFSIERYKKNIKISMPLYYNFENLYPVEFKISKDTLKLIEKMCNIKLPKEEAIGIGMNILNAELDVAVNQRSKDVSQVIEETTKIIEKEYNIKIVRESGNYARYVSHLQFLMERVEKRALIPNYHYQMYQSFKDQYPQASKCADDISDYILRYKHYKLSRDELLYLMIHINRLCLREECYQ